MNERNVSRQIVIIEYGELDRRDEPVSTEEHSFMSPLTSSITSIRTANTSNPSRKCNKHDNDSNKRIPEKLKSNINSITPRKDNISQCGQTQSLRSTLSCPLNSKRINKLYKTTGRSVSTSSWLNNFESKCSLKQYKYNNSTKKRRRRKLLSYLYRLNRVNVSRSLGVHGAIPEEKRISRRLSTSVSSQIHRNNTTWNHHYSTEKNNDKKVIWYNMELQLVRDGCVKIVNGWLNPVLCDDDGKSLNEKDPKKVEEYIKKIVDGKKSSVVKRFVGKKIDKNEAILYGSTDNGAFSLWSKPKIESDLDSKPKSVSIKKESKRSKFYKKLETYNTSMKAASMF